MTRAEATARRRRAFSDGFTVGLAAPALLIAGLFEAPIQTRRTSLAGVWNRVGQQLRAGMTEYRATAPRDTWK